MITGVHGMFCVEQAEELRAFMRDKLGLPATDIGEGWLIFSLPRAEMGVHPMDQPTRFRHGEHNISLCCDDIHQTVAELQARGVEFEGEITDQGYGLVALPRMPGGLVIDLYQPRYQTGD